MVYEFVFVDDPFSKSAHEIVATTDKIFVTTC